MGNVNGVEYRGHKTLRGDIEDAPATVCLYTTGDYPELDPAHLVHAPKEFNHAPEGEEPRFQYQNWFICDPATSRWDQYEQDGKQVLRLSVYRFGNMPRQVMLAQLFEIVSSIAIDSGFLAFTVNMCDPKKDPFPEELPGDVDDLPPAILEKDYFNMAGNIQIANDDVLRQVEQMRGDRSKPVATKRKRRQKIKLR